ncbi:MAG: glycoside hydrolase family 38 C-terminal domain-containing protein [Monoglobaceae bacterium]
MEVKKIDVVSNTHWDREFRRSFEKTRRNLLIMLDTTLDILESDPEYHSFTMDGHSIMIDDYLEMRPERREQVEKFVKEGRLIIGPYFTLPEEFTISHEAIVRNLMFGRATVEKYGGKTGTVAYTPSSWGQTGQLPQIFADFGLTHMMFYRGISHHEAPAEYIWEAPDGTKMLASRFALYCRYNWYYQVHRAVSRNRVWSKDYKWGEFDEVPFRPADGCVGAGVNYDLKMPAANYNKENLKQAILDMLEEEKGHFTTPVFLGMNGHDISVAFPRESEVIKDAKELFDGEIEIEHTDLEGFWRDAEKYLDKDKMTVLKGERRAYLKEGKWTYLFPGTISARTYLKQADFDAYTALTYMAEPLNALAWNDSKNYLTRGWRYLLSCHSHDANGGCAPDEVCKDMEYRYRKARDIADIVADDAMIEIAKNLSPEGQDKTVVQLVVYNPLPFERDVIVPLDIDVPDFFGNGIEIDGVKMQAITSGKSSVFVDNIWEVPTILDSVNHRFYAKLKNVPALGYRAYEIKPAEHALLKKPGIAMGNVLENGKIRAAVNGNGTIDVLYKPTGKEYKGLNYLTSQGEVGNAWKHVSPEFDKKFMSLGANAKVYTAESGELTGSVAAEFDFEVPESCEVNPSEIYAKLPVKVTYTLDEDADYIKVRVELCNTAKDHWLRANFPTGISADFSVCDSHFDIVKHDIEIPDSTGWVEQAFGTQPLRTFAAVTDGENGFAVMPKGLYEYEVFDDSTMALTLIRACRIKLAVSEEKQTELDDEGVQCPGRHTYEYAMHFDGADYAKLPNKAAEIFAGVKCAAVGRGKGTLKREGSLFAIDNRNIHVTAVKRAEDGNGVIVRFYNAAETEQKVTITADGGLYRCKMTEEDICEVEKTHTVGAKKIETLRIVK